MTELQFVIRLAFLLDHLHLRVGDLPLCVLRVLLAGADAGHEAGEGTLRDRGGPGAGARHMMQVIISDEMRRCLAIRHMTNQCQSGTCQVSRLSRGSCLT